MNIAIPIYNRPSVVKQTGHIRYLIKHKLLSATVFVIALLCNTLTIAEPFIIGVEDNRYLPHYSFENGEYIGFAKDVLDAFFTDSGYQYSFRALPVTRLFQTFMQGRLDFKYPDNSIWSADLKKGHDIKYSQPVIAYIDGVSVLPVNLGRQVDEITLLGTVRGFSAYDWLDRIQSGHVLLTENSSTERLIQQALIGRIQGAYANIDVIQFILNHQLKQGNALVFDDSLPHTRSNYRLSSIKHPLIIAQFDRWMDKHQTLLNELKLKYGIRELE